MSDFDRAIAVVLKEEGGLVDNPADPGGLTNMGISKRAYPLEDIANLTVDRAKELYKRDYWNLAGCEGQPYGNALVILDCAVNQGVTRAKGFSLDVPHDGNFVVNFQARRMMHYASLQTWLTFGKGWSRRLLRIAIEAGK